MNVSILSDAQLLVVKGRIAEMQDPLEPVTVGGEAGPIGERIQEYLDTMRKGDNYWQAGKFAKGVLDQVE